MFTVKLAGYTIRVDNRYDFVEKMCKQYISETDTVDFTVSVSTEDMENEKLLSPEEFSEGYLESLAIYRHIGEEIGRLGGFIFHSAVIEYKGKAYAFAAKSGTGKSTHIRLWRKAFGDGVGIVNGDKPIFRFVGDELYAYGTPWCGKEGFHRNVGVPLGAVCFIERGESNSIEQLPKKEFTRHVFNQVYMPKNGESCISILDMLDKMSETVKVYKLKCNMDIQAAYVARDGMVSEE